MKLTLITTIISLFFLPGYSQTKKIIFVCEHGVAKSVIATSLFNKLAADRGLNYEAVCRATAPDSTLSPSTRAGLRKDNIAENRNPQKLTSGDTADAALIIHFIPLPNEFKTSNIPTEDWSRVQNIDATYDQRKEAITRQINALIDSLKKK